MTAAPDSTFDAPEPSPARLAKTRPLYWSVRRELWEHRMLHMAPLVAAAVVLVGYLLSTIGLGRQVRAAAAGASGDNLLTPYSFLAMALIITGFGVGALYCLSALYGERRDRGFLFWKSLPVSDLTTITAKAAIPLVVLPAIIWAVTIATHLVMLLIGSLIVLTQGLSVTTLWAHLPLARIWGILSYGLVTNALWHAPIYAWLLLVSAWARRTPLLWALGPPLALCAVEALAFKAAPFRAWLIHRLTGAPAEAFVQTGDKGLGRLPQIDPLKFLGTPGLWLGLLVAAAFLAGAVWRRRRRELT
jgi:ABC-2 type transport system permease protein